MDMPLSEPIELDPDSLDPSRKPIVKEEENERYSALKLVGEVVWYILPFDFDLK